MQPLFRHGQAATVEPGLWLAFGETIAHFTQVRRQAGRQLQQEVKECCLADNLRNQVDLADAELAELKRLCDRVAAQLGR